MPVEGQVHGPAPAGEPFVCVAGCKGPAGLHPRGTMRYGIFQPGRRDPRAHVNRAQPWAQWCASCFGDMQETLNAAPPAGAADSAAGAAAAGASTGAAAADRPLGTEPLGGDSGAADQGADEDGGWGGGADSDEEEAAAVEKASAAKGYGLADDEPSVSVGKAASKKQRAHAIVSAHSPPPPTAHAAAHCPAL